MSFDRECTFLLPSRQSAGGYDGNNEQTLLKNLESPDDEIKIAALKQLIVQISNGENYPKALMAVIKYCLNSQNHTIKKLTLLFWEVVDRRTPDGKLCPEMILVCNAMKNYLEHPNEYVRGNTLRLLTKLLELDILESLTPSILANLTHRHSYVRKNAVMATMAIHRAFPDLLGSVEDIILKVLDQEYSPIVRRNALLCYSECNIVNACYHVVTLLPTLSVQSSSIICVCLQIMQNSVVHVPQLKATFISYLHELLSNTANVSTNVLYLAANVLLSMTSATVAIKTSVDVYIDLLTKCSDQNVKLVILARIALISKQPHIRPIVQENLVDLCKVLNIQNSQLRSDILSLVIALTPSSIAIDIVNIIKKELLTSAANSGSGTGSGAQQDQNANVSVNVDIIDKNQDAEAKYRSLLVNALHLLALEHPSVVIIVAPLLSQFLPTANTTLALHVLETLRTILYNNVDLRETICLKLLDGLRSVSSVEVIRGIIWLIGEYLVTPTPATPYTLEQLGLLCNTSEQIVHLCQVEKLVPESVSWLTPTYVEETKSSQVETVTTTVVHDGVYVTQTVELNPNTKPTSEHHTHIYQLLSSLHGLLVSNIMSCLTKLYVHIRMITSQYTGLAPEQLTQINRLHANIMLLGVRLLKLSTHINTLTSISDPLILNSNPYIKRSTGTFADTTQRIQTCIKILLDPNFHFNLALIYSEQDPFIAATFANIEKQIILKKESGKQSKNNIIDSIIYRHLGCSVADTMSAELLSVDNLASVRRITHPHADDEDTTVATPTASRTATTTSTTDAKSGTSANANTNTWTPKVSLSGLSDPVYVEAQLLISCDEILVRYDVTNLTNKSYQNVCLDVHLTKNLSLSSRPKVFNLAKHATQTITVTLNVSSTDKAHVMCDLVLDAPNGNEKMYINLLPLNIDLINFIVPSTCEKAKFRSMWAEFEWENKVPTYITQFTLYEFIQLVTNCTNMVPIDAMDDYEIYKDGSQPSFLAFNLYATSYFSEEALMNVSVEYHPATETTPCYIQGFTRIRAKTQGIALGLGDVLAQKLREQTNSKLINSTEILVENV